MDKNLATEILKLAKQQGASSAEVDLSTNKGFIAEVRLGETETVEHYQNQGMSVTVYFGHKCGTAYSSDLSSEAIELTIEKACSIAKYTEEDPFAGLADAKLMAHDYPNLDLYHPWEIAIPEAIELATECERIGMEQDKRITNSEGAGVYSAEHYGIYANSHGFIGDYPTTRHSISCSLLAEKNGAKELDSDYTVARDAAELTGIDEVAKKTAQKTVARLGAKKIKTQSCPILFRADIARSLIAAFLAAISGGNIYRESSFLLNHLNKKIFPEFFHIHEQPHLLKRLGSKPFDSEGVATYAKDFIKEGVLQSYILSSYSARKLKLQSTANSGGVHNLFVESTGEEFAELLRSMGKGLLVTELMGQGSNIVTGDYSRGAVGFWVENGQIQYPVHEITIAGNLKNMFNNVVAIGKDIDRRGNINTGSILVESMTVAGQ